MDFVTIEELAKASGKSRRTIDRKLLKLQTEQPDKFKELTRIPPGTKRIFYHPQIMSFIGGPSDEIIEDVKAEITGTPRKKKPKTYNPEPPPMDHAQVIPIDQMPADQQTELADFKLILEDYKTGQWSLPECIHNHGVDQKKFFYWINTRPLFNQLYTEVYEIHKRSFNILMRELGKESLRKLVTGYDKSVESVTYMQRVAPNGETVDIPMERRVSQKHILPNVQAVVFALTNKDPDEWKRYFNPVDPNRDVDRHVDPLEQMSDMELMDIVNEAMRTGLLTTGDTGQQNEM